MCTCVCHCVCVCVSQASLPQSPQAAIALRVPSLAVAAGHHVILQRCPLRIGTHPLPSPPLALYSYWVLAVCFLSARTSRVRLHIAHTPRCPKTDTPKCWAHICCCRRRRRRSDLMHNNDNASLTPAAATATPTTTTTTLRSKQEICRIAIV